MRDGARTIRALAMVALAAGVAAGCRKSEVAADRPGAAQMTEASSLTLFAPLPQTMAKGPLSPAMVTLGRTLYYETLLSEGHDVSCNGCHPLNGYGADGRRVSFGHKGQQGSRNSPTVYNAAAQFAQFWDGRAPDVEAQAKGPVLNPAEMGMPDSAAVLAHLRGDARYRSLFAAAFPREKQPITYDNMGKAIGAFERGLVTPSKWDAYLKGDRGAITPEERAGFRTFSEVGCASCHNGVLVGGNSFQKLGKVRPWPSQADSGRYAVTKSPSDIMVFKVPMLRNVAMTGPYFHDGSTATLPEAVRLMALHQLGRELSDSETTSIVTWLHTLTGDIPVPYVAHPPLPASQGAKATR